MTSGMNAIDAVRPFAEEQRSIPDDLALAVLHLDADLLPDLLAVTNRLRINRFENVVRLCSIINARNGLCGENCRFCAQSAHYETPARQVYSMLPPEEIQAGYDQASERPIEFFSIVTSGGKLAKQDVEAAILAMQADATQKVADGQEPVQWCASLGGLSEAEFVRLKEAGLVRYHHNLESAESFYGDICTTHSYQDRIGTIRRAKAAGLNVCSGALLGMGESLEQRVELADALSKEDVDSIPLNFLIPIPGTPMADRPIMSPVEILLAVAMFRLKNPASDLRIAGGRQHLGRLQSALFWAGCNGLMIGDLLTTAGHDVDEDVAMIRSLGLVPSRELG